jgi:hypothetical protein
MLVKVTTKEYHRTDSGKGWKSKPYEVEVKDRELEYWLTSVSPGTVGFFRAINGYERLEYGYTSRGHMPVQITSISPDKQIKIVRTIDDF